MYGSIHGQSGKGKQRMKNTQRYLSVTSCVGMDSRSHSDHDASRDLVRCGHTFPLPLACISSALSQPKDTPAVRSTGTVPNK